MLTFMLTKVNIQRNLYIDYKKVFGTVVIFTMNGDIYQDKCWIPKANSGKGIGFIAILLAAGLMGGFAMGFLLQPIIAGEESNDITKLTFNVNDFYVKFYDGSTFLETRGDFEVIGIMFMYMTIDLDTFEEFQNYDNVSEYAISHNATGDEQFTKLGLLNMEYIVDANYLTFMMSGVSGLNASAIHSIENNSFDLEWKGNQVVILSGISLMIANRTGNDITFKTTNDGYDIVGNEISDSLEENMDIVNMTSIAKDKVFYPSHEYVIDIDGIDYDIDASDDKNLHIRLNNEVMTITDKEIFAMIT